MSDKVLRILTGLFDLGIPGEISRPDHRLRVRDRGTIHRNGCKVIFILRYLKNNELEVVDNMQKKRLAEDMKIL